LAIRVDNLIVLVGQSKQLLL